MGAKWTRKIQWGLEAATAQGTIVVASSIARATGTFQNDYVFQRHVEDVNLINGNTDQFITRKGGSLSMSFDPISFEQICDVLDCAISVAVASVDGAGSDYIREYPFPTVSTLTNSTKTLQFGDESGAEVMEYSFVDSLSLEGRPGAAFTLNAEWYGRQQVPQAFTGGLAIPTVSPLIFGGAKLYIDAATATPTTLIDCTVLGVRFDLDTGLTPKYCANGTTTFGELKRSGFVPTLNLTLEVNTNGIAQKAIWLANTPQRIKLLIEGAAVTSAGTTYSKKTLIIDMCGTYNPFGAMGETDGNNIYEVTFNGAYNVAAAYFGMITAVNDLAALP